jgi:hypothetical protein
VVAHVGKLLFHRIGNGWFKNHRPGSMSVRPHGVDPPNREGLSSVIQGVDWLSVRPLIKNAPIVSKPGPVD